MPSLCQGAARAGWALRPGSQQLRGYHRQQGRGLASWRLDIVLACLSVSPHHTKPQQCDWNYG